MFRKIGSELKKHVLTGISYMIPLVIAGAVIMAIARLVVRFSELQIFGMRNTQTVRIV